MQASQERSAIVKFRMETKKILEEIIDDCAPEKFALFFRKLMKFAEEKEPSALARFSDTDFTNARKLGEIRFSPDETLLVASFQVTKELSERAGKKAQYEKARKVLKETRMSAGIFIFCDTHGNFRFSLVYPEATGRTRQWNNFRRFTYFVSKEFTNKTFLERIGGGDFSTLEKVKEAFSIGPVTDIFYKEFFVVYEKLVQATKNANKNIREDNARDFILLLAIRTIFLGFIQKRKWLGNDEKFLQSFFFAYQTTQDTDMFYEKWLAPLFFEALNSTPGTKVSYGNNNFTPEMEEALQMAPYLNGGLFRKRAGYDNQGWTIPDFAIKEFFDFLFAHSFTIEEGSIDDAELQLNPEFLGIIFERLINKENGAVYTPRTEVDFMCRLSLVKWLEKNLESSVRKSNLYELFFRESENPDEQKEGSFSEKEAKEIVAKLEDLAICDPAAGSGAFLVGMMQVLDEIEQNLRERFSLEKRGSFERKKQIIARSLYGVEVKEWAVWIAQLRLWLSLFVEAPEESKTSFDPILPSLDFKVRKGDSLVQNLGGKMIPVSGEMYLKKDAKMRFNALKKFKEDYFYNRLPYDEITYKEREALAFASVFDDLISEKKKAMQAIQNTPPQIQKGLFGAEAEINQQEVSLFFEQQKEMGKEIERLEEERRQIKEEHPLVWSIEFAEVFGGEKGGFDIVIGNPPYVRQEEIADPTGKKGKEKEDKKEYKNLLQEMVKIDFPNDFPPKAKINAQSDLYTYFYIRGLRLLNPTGIHTFICSNSWLDVGYGVWLQDFLLKRASVELIIDNHAKRSFDAADVNTIISIIHAPQKKIDPSKQVKFVAFKKPFEEAIFTENLLAIDDARETISNDVFRVYPITAKELREAGTEYENEEQKTLGGKYVGDKWGGKYLRAPDIFFTILEKGKGKLVKLGDIAEVRFGIKTGVNEFFYLTEAMIAEWKIEEEFLKPVIKSPRECKSIVVDPKNLKFKIFLCNKTKAELAETNALKYIEWGEKQKTEEGIFWKDIQSVKGRRLWYSLGERRICNFIVPCSFGDSFKIMKNLNVLADKRMYEGYCDDDNVSILLNSTLFPLFMETGTRLGLGEGLLDVTVEEVQKIKIINPKIIKHENSILTKRPIKSIFEECGIDPKSKTPIEEQEPKPLPDRAELDAIVFDALDLTQEERKEVYRAVCRLVWNRISKAGSV